MTKYQALDHKFTYFLNFINSDLWIENEEKLNTFVVLICSGFYNKNTIDGVT